MRIHGWLLLSFFSIMIMLGGCSGVEHAFVTKDSEVSRTKSLVIMRIKWVEEYNDTKDKEEKVLYSQNLLSNLKLVEDKRVDIDKPELYQPLHYLFDFQFQLIDQQKEKHFFNRFGRDLREYEEIAIYEFDPGHYKMNNIVLKQQRFALTSSRDKDVERWKEHIENYQHDFGSWDLEKGRIIYLGDLTMFFKTKRFVFGLLSPEEVVDTIVLNKISLEDHFEEIKEQLKTSKDWFPADEMINKAMAKEIILEKEAEENENLPGDKSKKKGSFF